MKIKVDLITGFLGAGKTTFLKQYINHLLSLGYKVGIIENDFGAINIDTLLLQDILDKGVILEQVHGGSDIETHRRRFKTKLIALKMQGMDYVVVEPSGIYDVDEFFDVLYDEPLYEWYQINNIIGIVDSTYIPSESNYIMASELANCGTIVLSKTQEVDDTQIQKVIDFISQSLNEIHVRHKISDLIISKPFDTYTSEDYDFINQNKYKLAAYLKKGRLDVLYQTIYILNQQLAYNELINQIKLLLQKDEVLRIKGFTNKDGKWIQINASKQSFDLKEVEVGQEVLIVIGKKIKQTDIEGYFRK